jgi:hypothetical protein
MGALQIGHLYEFLIWFLICVAESTVTGFLICRGW